MYTDSNLNIVLNNDLRCFLNVSRLSIGLSCDGRKDRQINGHDWLHTVACTHLYMPPVAMASLVFFTDEVELFKVTVTSQFISL